MGQTPDLTEVIEGAIDSAFSGVSTAMPARVESYDATTQKAVVQPLAKHYYIDEKGDRVSEIRPTVQGVPVMFPGAGAYRITWPIVKGDLVLLIAASCSMDRIKAGKGGITDPIFDDKLDLSNSIALAGFHTFGRVPTTAPTNAMVMHAASLKLGSATANDPVARKSDLQEIVTWLNDHIHPASAGVTSPSTPPVATPNCSSKVKLD